MRQYFSCLDKAFLTKAILEILGYFVYYTIKRAGVQQNKNKK